MLFIKYFEKIFKYYPNPNLYLRGGSVFNIKVFQDTNCLIKIKDFDFVLEDERCCNEHFYHDFSKEFGVFLNGCNKKSQEKNTKLHIMRHCDSLKYELSVCIKDPLELPMTYVKILITEQNYISLLTSLDNIDYKFDTNSLKTLDIIINNHNEHGMFQEEFISDNTIISNIVLNTTNDKCYQQFLYYLIKNPTNIARLKYKNIPKSKTVKNLYKSPPSWLLNEDLMMSLVENLIVNISSYINDIFDCYKDEIIDLTKKIINDDNEMIINECIYDLVGIGGNPFEVIDFLNGKNDNEIIREAPCIKNLKDKKSMINKIEKLSIKCQKYNIAFNPDMIFLNPAVLKEHLRINRDLLRTNLTNIYVEMFQTMDKLFENININRWIHSFDKSDPLIQIFEFSNELILKLNDIPIIMNGKILSQSSSWLIINKIKTLK